MTHPEAACLSDFASGLLDEASAHDIERHLAECPACCERAAAGKDGSVVCLRSAAKDTCSTYAQATQDEDLGSMPPALRDHPRYRVLRLLGRGGMGEVWLAEHRVMQRMVALKVIRRDLLDSPSLAERFKREVLATAKLSHAHIVAALDAEQAGDIHFLVMEFVDGSSVAAHLHAHGMLPVAEACGIARQAALALQHAHEQGLVHRDIKPENLLRSGDGTVKVADFGLARLLRGPEAASSAATSAGLLLGTVDYIAPEQANDPTRAGIRADIYSLGCTLYQLLTGQVPYPGGGVLDKLAGHMGGRPMRLGQLRPDVPLVLCRVVERMMAADPEKRFAAPGEAAAALEPFVQERKAEKPRRWLWAAAALLLAAAAGAVGAAVYTFRTAKGTIEIVSDDPDVAVMAKGRDGKVVVIDEKTGRKVSLAPGEYDLQLEEGGKKLELSTDRISLTRNGTVIVRVTFKKEAKAKPPIPVPPVVKADPVKWPGGFAELMKAKPDMDDGLTDSAASPFDPFRGFPPGKRGDDGLGISAAFGKDGLEARFARNEKPLRFISMPHEVGSATDGCLFLIRARLESNSPGGWGVMLGPDDPKKTFLVRLWNDGSLEVGESPATGAGVAVPKVARKRHAAIRKGREPNELAVLVRGGRLRVAVNGTEVVASRSLPAGLSASKQALFAFQASKGPGRMVFTRCRRWPLAGAAPRKSKPVMPADLRSSRRISTTTSRMSRPAPSSRPNARTRSPRIPSTGSVPGCSRARATSSS